MKKNADVINNNYALRTETLPSFKGQTLFLRSRGNLHKIVLESASSQFVAETLN